MFKNLHELLLKMPTEKDCRDYLVQVRWNGKPVCPYCGYEDKAYVIEGGKRFKCGSVSCFKKYSVTVGTIFEKSTIPLTKWLNAVYVVTAHKKGISSHQLGRDLGVTQRTAWFMLHRIREMMKNVSDTLLDGIVEIDETYMAKKFRSEYQALTPAEVDAYVQKPNMKSKGAVIGVAQRDGQIRVEAWDSRSKEAISTVVSKHIDKDNSIVMTDESTMYNKILKGYNRRVVNHSSGVFVQGIAHVNNVEAFWSVMKRGVYGIYHQISYKHLQRYCDEYSYRYNTRKIKDVDRFPLALQNMERRLKYEDLIRK